MERPAPSLIGSVAVHAGVIGAVVAALLWGPAPPPDRPVVNAVPVSIVSDTIIEAAAPDNPSDELITEDATTAPVALPPEPAAEPTPPTPAPPPPAPVPAKKAPTPRPTPPRPTLPTPAPPKKATPRPTPPRPAPAQPTPPREALDLDALAGPPRAATRPGTRPATGQQGRGAAPQATGPQVTAIFNQVYPNWILPCDIPGARDLRIQMDVTLDARGRITDGPNLIGARSDSVYRAAADGAVRALRQTAPFDVPEGFPGGAYRPTFNTERACRNR